MEKLQKEIIKILKDDCRLRAKEIAVLVNSTEEAVAQEIEKLEEQGVILKYSAVVNSNKTESGVQALIEVRVTPQRAKGFDAIAAEIYNFDEVKSVYLMSGAYDLAVFIEAPTLQDIAMFVTEKLSCVGSVISTATHFILKKYKNEGVIFETDNENRLKVQA